MSARLKLLVADVDTMREGIRMALHDEVDICGEVATVEQAIRVAKREQPELCLVGTELADGGVRAVRGVCRAAPHAAVIVLDPAGDVETLLDSVREGAVGYVPGPIDAAQLRRVVSAAAAREAVIPRSLVRELLSELRGGGTSADSLTPRESQVLGMLRRGRSTAEIAGRLKIAPVTVRRHISALVHKLGVEGRSGLLEENVEDGGSIQVSAHGVDRGLDTAREPELAEDAGDVLAHGVLADPERVRDRRVLHPVRDQT